MSDETQDTRIDARLLEALVCPITRATLIYEPDTNELVSPTTHLAFPIRSGIPVMLVDEARRIED
ncbi:Trm112 family protein [Abyssibius alkaniclasticus]|uniref:Trm112 family protein n=1 Tax=Abyssibius alkaniclasticus TaxID=2881234 RepID=UPI0023632A02|nr:Trm112 family protein [Abyssibius alkaniclasticus]UPH72028.1 Trm112 family protein [Abyssibius alkaniclasticus]|tara:strand:+ start:858 stop:1052 length:195 start_codon:yes stop_codon:yes gene_type:complete